MVRRALIAAVLVASLATMGLLCAVPRTAAADETLGVAASPAGIAMADAVRVRGELGLDVDAGPISALLADPSADRRLGTPLSAREIKLMEARATIQRTLQPLRDRLAASTDAFAGHWLSYPTGGTVDNAVTVNVNVVSGHDAEASDLRALVPSNATVELHGVPFSGRQLLDVRMALRADENWFKNALGTRLLMTETDVIHNQVVVYVAESNAGIAQAIEQHFGSGKVRVETLDGGGVDACTRLNCGPPWVGAVKIARVGAGNLCTLGVTVRKPSSSTYGMWTAGHCGSGTWKQGSTNGATIGATVSGSNHSVDGSTADVQVIAITASTKTNKYIADTASCNPCNTPALTGTQVQQGFNADEVGDSVCDNGAFTGRSCGTIQSTDVDNFEYPAGIHLFNQRRATYVRNGGDSGAPVVASIGLDVAGNHVHYVTISGVNRPIYSHVWEMSLVTGYYVWNGV
jgi:hypothetical protein